MSISVLSMGPLSEPKLQTRVSSPDPTRAGTSAAPSESRTCPNCGRPLGFARPNRRWCSTRCRNQAWQQANRRIARPDKDTSQ